MRYPGARSSSSWTTTSCTCSAPGSTADSSRCTASTGERRRWCSRRSSSTRRCTRCSTGTICAAASRRTGAGFGFFHPSLPDEPLIFVEVALCKGLAGSVTDLLFGAVEPEVDADTAIFYSISNCQRGLTGISFGNFLIKQVVRELAAEIPRLRRFATLSPIPGFRNWLVREAPEGRLPAGPSGGEAMLDGIETPDWPADHAPGEHSRADLSRLCAHYLLRAKRGIHPLDPVARFHLRNGARLERINWLSDPSPAGLVQSAGMMVNYVYDEAAVVANHEAFVNEGRVAHSRGIASLAGPAAEKGHGAGRARVPASRRLTGGSRSDSPVRP